MSFRLLEGLNLIMAATFTGCALAQYNDADALFWMTFYSVAALACVLARVKRLPPSAAAGYGVLALLLGVYTAYYVLSRPTALLDEPGREMMGALLVALWIGILFKRARRIEDGGSRMENRITL